MSGENVQKEKKVLGKPINDRLIIYERASKRNWLLGETGMSETKD